jgi:hypothetical protein
MSTRNSNSFAMLEQHSSLKCVDTMSTADSSLAWRMSIDERMSIELPDLHVECISPVQPSCLIEAEFVHKMLRAFLFHFPIR